MVDAAEKPLEESLFHCVIFLLSPAGQRTGFCPNMCKYTGKVTNLVELTGTQSGPSTG